MRNCVTLVPEHDCITQFKVSISGKQLLSLQRRIFFPAIVSWDEHGAAVVVLRPVARQLTCGVTLEFLSNKNWYKTSKLKTTHNAHP